MKFRQFPFFFFQIWENKLLQSRAVDGMPADNPQARQQQYMYPHIVQNNPGLHVPVTSAIARPQQQGLTYLVYDRLA